jgi:hypothetical protein
MAGSGTDDEDTAEFFFEADDEPPEREERPDPLGFPPKTVVHSGRRFRFLRWELRTQSGKRAKPRFFYRRSRGTAETE